MLFLHIRASVDLIIYTFKDSVFLRILEEPDLRSLEYSKNTRKYDECNTDAEIEDLDEQLISDYKHRIGADDAYSTNIKSKRVYPQNKWRGTFEKCGNFSVCQDCDTAF